LVVDLVVDLVIWAMYRKYEYGDETYYQLIKEKIKKKFSWNRRILLKHRTTNSLYRNEG